MFHLVQLPAVINASGTPPEPQLCFTFYNVWGRHQSPLRLSTLPAMHAQPDSSGRRLRGLHLLQLHCSRQWSWVRALVCLCRYAYICIFSDIFIYVCMHGYTWYSWMPEHGSAQTFMSAHTHASFFPIFGRLVYSACLPTT